jgi:hypothetical protein
MPYCMYRDCTETVPRLSPCLSLLARKLLRRSLKTDERCSYVWIIITREQGGWSAEYWIWRFAFGVEFVRHISLDHFLEFVSSRSIILAVLTLRICPADGNAPALYVSNTHVGPISHRISGRGFPNWIRGARNGPLAVSPDKLP